MVALDYSRRLGHDNHPRLSKLHAGEEKKGQTSWGTETVDYEKIAVAAAQAMKTADVHRFLVVCALVPDMYCPGYDPRQSLEKDSNLARLATRYKVDSAKVGAAVRAELSKGKSKVKDQSQLAQKATTVKPAMFQSWPLGFFFCPCFRFSLFWAQSSEGPSAKKKISFPTLLLTISRRRVFSPLGSQGEEGFYAR